MTKEDCLNQARQHKKTGDEKASKRYYDGDDYYVASLYFLAAEKFEEVINCMEKWLVIRKRIVRQTANDKQYKNLKMGWILTEVQQYEELLEFLKNERLVRKLGQLLFSKPSPITNDMLTAISYTRFDESGRRIVRLLAARKRILQLFNSLKRLCWIPGKNCVCGNILCHNTACANQGVFTNYNSRKY